MTTVVESPVERQLEAYNARDVEAFVACYAPEVEVFELPLGNRTIQGREEMRQRYTRLFERFPGQRCKILARVLHAPFVVDHEEIEGRDGPEPVRAVAVYEVAEGLIRRVWFLRRDPPKAAR